MKINYCLIGLAGLFTFCVYACAPVHEGLEKSNPVGLTLNHGETGQGLHSQDRNSDSFQFAPEVVDRIESVIDRKTVLPKMEDLYLNIIHRYQKSPLAQECYLKLISIYVEDYSPPEFEKAEMLYKEFLSSYPRSILIRFMEDKLGNSYYANADWDRLLKLTTPRYQEYIESGDPVNSTMLFMYSEANFHLGNVKEAEEGYARVSEMLPESTVGVQSKKRLSTLGIQTN